MLCIIPQHHVTLALTTRLPKIEKRLKNYSDGEKWQMGLLGHKLGVENAENDFMQYVENWD